MSYDDLLELKKLLNEYLEWECLKNNPLKYLQSGTGEFRQRDLELLDKAINKMNATANCLKAVEATIEYIDEDDDSE